MPPSPIAFPPGPSWVIVNLDNLLSVPLLGQFDPNIKWSKGKPIWQKKPGIGGGEPWLKYIGHSNKELTFEFVAYANSIVDPYPFLAWLRLNELAAIDETLGRPPRLLFTHGPVIVEGVITDLPAAPIVYWGTGAGGKPLKAALRSRLVRQVGPISVTLTVVPKKKALLGSGTNVLTRTEETDYDELSLTQYGDARYGQSVAIYNQGVRIEEKIELPRLRSNSNITKSPPVAPYLGESIDASL